MIALLYTAVVLCNISQSTMSKLNRGGDAIRFNFFKGGAACLVFFSIFLFSREEFHLPTMLYGALQGVLLAIANQLGYKALQLGPMALTSMLVKFSLIIPFLFGILRLGETPSIFALVALLLLLTSLVFLNLRRRGGDDNRPSLKWALCTLVTLLANGFCEVVTTMHQRAFPEQFEYGYTAWTTVSCLLIFSVLALYGGKLKREYVTKSGDLLACGAGIVNTLSSFFTVFLAACSPASVLYPLLAATTMLGALLVGRLVFRERLSALQLTGFAIGVLSVIFFNL